MKVTKQWIANVLNYLHGVNASDINLPEPDATKNSLNDDRAFANTWSNELYELRESNPQDVIRVGVEGVDLVCYNLDVDDVPCALVLLEYNMIEPEEVALVDDHCPDAATALDEWLGNKTLEEYDAHHAITLIAKKIAE